MLDRLHSRSLLALILVLAMSNWLFAASPVIGMAIAQGGFRVNATSVTGNATLFDGSLLETGKASSSVRLDRCVRLQLAGSSRSRIYQDHAILEQGSSEIEGAYRLQALGLNIEPADPNSAARVFVDNGSQVRVAVLRGSFRVMNAVGYSVGNIVAGSALAFEPQAAGAAVPSTMVGCLVQSEGTFFLKEETSGVKPPLKGSKLNTEAGNRVEVVGTTIANQQVQVTTLKRLSKSCTTPPVAAAAGSSRAQAGAAAGSKAATGMAANAKIIIAGVAIAAAGGTAAGIYKATGDDTPSASR